MTLNHDKRSPDESRNDRERNALRKLSRHVGMPEGVSRDVVPQPDSSPDIPDRIGESHGSPGGAERVEEQEFLAIGDMLTKYFDTARIQIDNPFALCFAARLMMSQLNSVELEGLFRGLTEFSGPSPGFYQAYAEFLRWASYASQQKFYLLRGGANFPSPNPGPADSPERLTEAPLVTPTEEPATALDRKSAGAGVPGGAALDPTENFDVSYIPSMLSFPNELDEAPQQAPPPSDGAGSEVAFGPYEILTREECERRGIPFFFVGRPSRSVIRENLP